VMGRRPTQDGARISLIGDFSFNWHHINWNNFSKSDDWIMIASPFINLIVSLKWLESRIKCNYGKLMIE